MKADYIFANGRGLEFLREVNNVASGFGGFVAIADRPTTVDLRIVSDGTTLRASYRFAGGAWTSYGEPAPVSAAPAPRIGVYVKGLQRAGHPRAGRHARGGVPLA